MREVGHYAAEVEHYASSGGGIMLQVVDANARGGALCFRGGASILIHHLKHNAPNLQHNAPPPAFTSTTVGA